MLSGCWDARETPLACPSPVAASQRELSPGAAVGASPRTAHWPQPPVGPPRAPEAPPASTRPSAPGGTTRPRRRPAARPAAPPPRRRRRTTAPSAAATARPPPQGGPRLRPLPPWRPRGRAPRRRAGRPGRGRTRGPRRRPPGRGPSATRARAGARPATRGGAGGAEIGAGRGGPSDDMQREAAPAPPLCHSAHRPPPPHNHPELSLTHNCAHRAPPRSPRASDTQCCQPTSAAWTCNARLAKRERERNSTGPRKMAVGPDDGQSPAYAEAKLTMDHLFGNRAARERAQDHF